MELLLLANTTVNVRNYTDDKKDYRASSRTLDDDNYKARYTPVSIRAQKGWNFQLSNKPIIVP